jgi:putative (di)nucleoside polyphosphate hydrolase
VAQSVIGEGFGFYWICPNIGLCGRIDTIDVYFGLVQVIDSQGYRANVGIILSNREGRVLWARRLGQDSWQFPQGGIKQNETPEEALFRELREEVGLKPEQVEVIGCTQGWLRYRLPKRFIRFKSKPLCIGQKQRWFVLRLLVDDNAVRLDVSEKPEFEEWRWVDYWLPLKEIVFFKRKVYKKALSELETTLFPGRNRSRHEGEAGNGTSRQRHF